MWVHSPPCENTCVRSLGYIVGASPPPLKICVSVRWVTLWVRPPLCVSVQLLTLACCLLRFAAFFNYDPILMEKICLLSNIDFQEVIYLSIGATFILNAMLEEKLSCGAKEIIFTGYTNTLIFLA